MIKFYTKIGRRVIEIDSPVFQFPGGELHGKAEPETFIGREIAWIEGPVDVNDYIKLNIWHQIVADQGGEAHVFIPYLPAARADRGIPFGAGIYGDLIASVPGIHVYTLDTHSDVIIDYIESKGAVVEDFPFEYFEDLTSRTFGAYDGVIAPDAGAVDRATSFAKFRGVPVIEASKVRDFETGQLFGFSCPKFDNPNGWYLVRDDICDGGGTFNGLAQAIRDNHPYCEPKIDLFVTHGIFSKGITTLATMFRHIYTTNSFFIPLSIREHAQVTVIDIKTEMIERIVE